MASLRVPFGILISSDGPYSVVSKSMLCGALLGIDDARCENADLDFAPMIGNPAGDLTRYSALASEMLAAGVKHVVGCYTSSSRKEIIPQFEKADALLWYPSHYEGFETSNNVVYTGAVANQHLFPLVEYMLGRFGPRAFCVGSNYIWAWENNRILREAIVPNGGTVLAERYLPVGSLDFGHVVEAILASRPSFVFNTLIGESSYQFLRDLRATCRSRGIDQPTAIPVASCTLSEPELDAIGPAAVDGHITSSVYFDSIETPENERFVAAYRARFPDGPVVSADAEATYLAVRFLARATAEAGTTEIGAVKRAVPRQSIAAPQGLVRIDGETLHAELTPRIGCSDADGRFIILREAVRPVAADPYLIRKLLALRCGGDPARAASRFMTTQRLIQNFRQGRGLLWAGSHFDAETLERTLLRLGVTLHRVEQIDSARLDPDRDIVFIDADQAINTAALIGPGATLPDAPVIGIVGVEAPSRLKLLAEAGATAILRKPIQSSMIYSALFLGVNNYRRLRAAETRVAIGERKRRGRRFLIKAVVALVQTHGLSDDQAYADLRRESMRRRIDIEEYCEALFEQGSSFPAAWPVGFAPTEPSNQAGEHRHAPTTDAGGRDDGPDVADDGEGRRSDQARRA